MKNLALMAGFNTCKWLTYLGHAVYR